MLASFVLPRFLDVYKEGVYRLSLITVMLTSTMLPRFMEVYHDGDYIKDLILLTFTMHPHFLRFIMMKVTCKN